MAEKLPPRKARQGRLGMPVLLILVAALVLAALAWWGAEIYGTTIEPEQTIGEPDNTPESAEGN
jgi:cytoskeletal protein RodZ